MTRTHWSRTTRRIVAPLAAVVLAVLVAAPPAAAFQSILAKTDDYTRDGISDPIAVFGGNFEEFISDGANPGKITSPTDVGAVSGYARVATLSDDNHDGIGDLVGIKTSDNCLYRWNGTGGAGFTNPVKLGCGWTPYKGSLAGAGDLNHDGNGDLVAINSSDHHLYEWLGNGSGGFNPIHEVGGGWTPYLTTTAPTSTLTGVGDINGDGNADIMAENLDTGVTSYWPGNGNGTFGTSHTAGGLPTFIFDMAGLGDITADGNGDVLVEGVLNPIIYKSNGAGSFTQFWTDSSTVVTGFQWAH